MEVMISSPPIDFNLDSSSTATSPFLTPPSTTPFLTPPSSPPCSPHFFSPFFSAPTTPSSSFRRLHATTTIPFSWEEKPGTPKTIQRPTNNFFDNLNVHTSLHAIPLSSQEKPNTLITKQRTIDYSLDISDVRTSLCHAIPFSWEEKPGTPKTKPHKVAEDFFNEGDFEFDFSGHIDRNSVSLSAADELFDGGVIRPLKPPPRLQFSHDQNNVDSPRSPRSPIKASFFKEALSPRHHQKKKEDFFDPFEAAIEQTRRESYNNFNLSDHPGDRQSNGRGRERTYVQKGSRRDKGTRSMSPFRVCDIFAENYQENSSSGALTTSKNCSRWKGYYKKWKLKDLLLFRSASEGRATTNGTYPLKKYSLLKQSGVGGAEDAKNNSSFRFSESAGSVSRRRGSGSGGPVSAHELHYTTNRAVSEEMRKKTFLPYNHGLLGCLGFNPPVHDISRGIGSVTRG